MFVLDVILMLYSVPWHDFSIRLVVIDDGVSPTSFSIPILLDNPFEGFIDSSSTPTRGRIYRS